MSAATAASPTLTTLPERAFSLHCSGLRSPAIAQQLGVPERTVRAWIARIRDDLAAANTALLREEFIRAVEHLHQLSAAAWAAFDAEQSQAHPRMNDALTGDPTTAGTSAGRPLPSLAEAQSSPPTRLAVEVSGGRTPAPASTSSAAPLPARGAARGAASDDAGAERAERAAARLRPERSLLSSEGRTGPGERSPHHSPRYLRLALDAQRHLSRLFGHFDSVRAELLDPAPAPAPASSPSSLGSAPVVVPASHPELAIPAKTAMDVTSPIEIPAKSATAGLESAGISAKSATSTPGLAAGIQPANPHPTTFSPALVPARHAAPIPTQGVARGLAETSGGRPREVTIPAKTTTPPPRPTTTRAFPANVPLHWRM